MRVYKDWRYLSIYRHRYQCHFWSAVDSLVRCFFFSFFFFLFYVFAKFVIDAVQNEPNIIMTPRYRKNAAKNSAPNISPRTPKCMIKLYANIFNSQTWYAKRMFNVSLVLGCWLLRIRFAIAVMYLNWNTKHQTIILIIIFHCVLYWTAAKLNTRAALHSND